MKPIPMKVFVPVALGAALAIPSTASAQYRLPDLVSVAEADSLHAAAVALAKSRYRWNDAARLHRASAALRAPEDTLGYRCYWEAGHLSYGTNDLANARSSMAMAGEQALARGDVLKAAQAFADAAWLANMDHKTKDVYSFGRKAEILAESPLISREQRETILARFVHKKQDLASTTAR
jgi:hypothetical protein